MVLVPDYGTQLELRRHQGGISPSAPPRPKPQLQSVPPILRRQHQNSMPGYSKGAQGLSVYVRVTGIFTGATNSPSALRRQCPNRYAIRAGRNFVYRPRFPAAQTIRSPDRSELRISLPEYFRLPDGFISIANRTISSRPSSSRCRSRLTSLQIRLNRSTSA